MLRFVLCCLLLAGVSARILAQDILSPYVTATFSTDALVQFSPDESRFIVVEAGQSLAVYKTGDTDPLLTLPLAETAYILLVRWNADNNLVLLASRDILYRLDIEEGTLTTGRALNDGKQFTVINFYQDDAVVAKSAQDMGSSLDYDDVYVFDAVTLKQRLMLPYAEDCTAALKTNPAAKDVVRFLNGLPNQSGECFPRITWNADHSRYLTWTFWNNDRPNAINVYDGATGELLHSLKHCAVDEAGEIDASCERLADLESVQWSPDGTKIMSLPEYARDGIQVWDAATGEIVQSLLSPTKEDRDAWYDGAAWHDETQIAAWGVGYIYVWDVATGERLFDWYHADNVVSGITWIQDGKLAVTWGEGVPWSQAVGEVWNAVTGEKLALIASSTASIEEVIDGPNDSTLYIRFQDRIETYDMEMLMKSWEI